MGPHQDIRHLRFIPKTPVASFRDALDWIAVLGTLRQLLDLFGRDGYGRWVLLIVLALIVSGFEMLGAVLVYTLLALVVDPAGSIDLPLIGGLDRWSGGAERSQLLLWLVASMGLFFALRAVVKIGAVYAQARVAHNAGARLSNRLVEGYLRWPYVAHLRRNSSELIRNGHHAVQEVVLTVVHPMAQVVAEATLIVGMVMVLAILAPAATAGAIVLMGGAAGLLLAVIQPRLKRIGEDYHHEAGITLGILQQSLHGLRDIKILGREHHFAAAYGQGRRRMARARYLLAVAQDVPKVVFETALLTFILLFFAFTLISGEAAQSVLSTLGLFAYAGLRMQPSLQNVVRGLNDLKYSAAPLADLQSDLEAVELAEQVEEAVPHPLPFHHRLVLDGVSFRYAAADRAALHGIHLAIRPGEQIGICGPSGGGKTTFVDVLSGLLQPSEGSITVDGADIEGKTRAWQRNLGIVPQMVFLTDDTLRRNIALGISDEEIDNDAIEKAIELAQLSEVVQGLREGLDTKVGERGVRLSGGQRQRIAIARALYRRPSVIIFDEGTSALDNETEASLMAAIESLRGDHTVLLIAHRLSTVRRSDRIVFLEEGRISGLGTFEQLRRDHANFRSLAQSD